MKTLSDQELIDLSISGDQRAFAEIVKRYQSYVATIAFNMVGDLNEAEDIGQQTFIRLFKALEKFEARSSLKTYISRICMNLSLTHLKKRQRRQKRHVDIDELKVHELSTESQEESIMNKDLIQKAMQRIKPKARMIINLRMIQEYSTKETAEVLGIAEGTVMSRLKRAMDNLKKELK